MAKNNPKHNLLVDESTGRYMAIVLNEYKEVRPNKFLIIGRRIIVTKEFLYKFHKFLKRSNDKRFKVLYHLATDFMLYNRILNDLVDYKLQIELCDDFTPSQKMISNSIKYRLLNKTGLVKSVSQFSQQSLNL